MLEQQQALVFGFGIHALESFNLVTDKDGLLRVVEILSTEYLHRSNNML